MSSGDAFRAPVPVAPGPVALGGVATGGRGAPRELRVQPARRASSAPGARAAASSIAVAFVAPAAAGGAGFESAAPSRAIGMMLSEKDDRPWGDLVTGSHGGFEPPAARFGRVAVESNVDGLARVPLSSPGAGFRVPMQLDLPHLPGIVPVVQLGDARLSLSSAGSVSISSESDSSRGANLFARSASRVDSLAVGAAAAANTSPLPRTAPSTVAVASISGIVPGTLGVAANAVSPHSDAITAISSTIATAVTSALVGALPSLAAHVAASLGLAPSPDNVLPAAAPLEISALPTHTAHVSTARTFARVVAPAPAPKSAFALPARLLAFPAVARGGAGGPDGFQSVFRPGMEHSPSDIPAAQPSPVATPRLGVVPPAPRLPPGDASVPYPGYAPLWSVHDTAPILRGASRLVPRPLGVSLAAAHGADSTDQASLRLDVSTKDCKVSKSGGSLDMRVASRLLTSAINYLMTHNGHLPSNFADHFTSDASDALLLHAECMLASLECWTSLTTPQQRLYVALSSFIRTWGPTLSVALATVLPYSFGAVGASSPERGQMVIERLSALFSDVEKAALGSCAREDAVVARKSLATWLASALPISLWERVAFACKISAGGHPQEDFTVIGARDVTLAVALDILCVDGPTRSELFTVSAHGVSSGGGAGGESADGALFLSVKKSNKFGKDKAAFSRPSAEKPDAARSKPGDKDLCFNCGKAMHVDIKGKPTPSACLAPCKYFLTKTCRRDKCPWKHAAGGGLGAATVGKK